MNTSQQSPSISMHSIGFLFALMGGLYAWVHLVGNASQSAIIEFILTLSVTGLLTGYLSVWLLFRGRSLKGKATGYFLLAPPAAYIGMWAGYIGHEVLDKQYLHGFPISFVLIVVVVATLVLALGVLFGLVLEKIAIWLWQMMPQEWILLPVSSWRARRISILLLALAGTCVYAWQKYPYPLEDRGDQPASSAWIDKEKTTYLKMLSSQHSDILVVPIQTEGRSLDRVQRSLITHIIVDEFSRQTGTELPDPTWVARALGAQARTIPDEEILALAKAMGARKVLISTLGIYGNPAKMRLNMELRPLDKGVLGIAATQKIDPILISDDLPPVVAIRGYLDSVIPFLTGKQRLAASSETSSIVSDKLPSKPIDLFQQPPASMLDAALKLQFVAALHDYDEVEREQLFERSLIALSKVGESVPLQKLLTARAYFELYNRPYALKVLGTPKSTEEKLFLAIMQGNLPEAELGLDQISNELLRGIAYLEAEHLRNQYGDIHGYESRREKLQMMFPNYAGYMWLPMSSSDWFNDEMYGFCTKAILHYGKLGPSLPITGSRIWAIISPYYFLGKNATTEAYVAMEIEHTQPYVYINNSKQWRQPAPARLAEWDHLDLIYSFNRTTFIKALNSRIVNQGIYDYGNEMAETASGVFGGYPRLMYLQAYALRKLADETTLLGKKNRLLDKSSRLARDGRIWEGGETPWSEYAEWYIWPRHYEQFYDEPIRPYRGWKIKGPLDYHDGTLPHSEIMRRIPILQRRLAYAQTDFGLVEELSHYQAELDLPNVMDVLAKDAVPRFVGNPARNKFIAEMQKNVSDPAQRIKNLESLIEKDPEDWSNYYQLGKVYGEVGNYQLAQDTFLSYPAFRDNVTSKVELSNEAEQAGYWLFNMGETELSLPLFKLSASYRSYSAREMASVEYMAFMKRNWPQAMGQALRAADRYNDSKGASHYISYLFLTGQNDGAWNSLKHFQPLTEGPEVWDAALIGHRLAGTSMSAVHDWIIDWGGLDVHRNYLSFALRERFAFMALVTDRSVSQETVKLLQSVTDHNNESPYYPSIAKGYMALTKGDYTTAIAHLEPESRTLTDISVERKTPLNDLLAYLAYAYAKSGKASAFESLLKNHRAKMGEDFDYLLARGILEGLSGKEKEATGTLRLAFNRTPPMDTRTFYPGYELLELCEWLYRDTGNESYRTLLLDIAQRQQKTFPTSWAYTFAAKYSPDKEDRIHAIGMAQFLDAQSLRLQGTPAEDIKAGQAWFSINNPFRVN